MASSRLTLFVPAITAAVSSIVIGFAAQNGPRISQAEQAVAPTPFVPRIPLDRNIKSIGRLEPEGDVVQVAASSTIGTARIARLLVQNGMTVQAGQLVAVLDTEKRLQSAVSRAEAQVREARDRLIDVQAGGQQTETLTQQAEVDRLAAELQMIQQDYARFQVLQQEGAISAAELDRKRLIVETTARRLGQAQKLLQSVMAARPADIRRAEAQVDVATANLQQAEADLDTAYIRSPITGQVLQIHSKVGETVNGNGLMELGNTRQMYAVAAVEENDIGKLRLGQSATITSPAFSGNVAGTVSEIGLQLRNDTTPTPDNQDNRVVEVKIRIKDSYKVSRLTNLKVHVAIRP
jgi:HlyD family secretion protein